MSNELKCPFCQQELNYDNPQSIECRNDDCKKTPLMYGSEELWQELNRTRKALEVAKEKLKNIKAFYQESYDCPDTVNWHTVAQRLANDVQDAIDQIKTITEQKDVK